jgi:hypothetical protein
MTRRNGFCLLQSVLIAGLIAFAGCTSGGSEAQTPTGQAAQASPPPSLTATVIRPTVAATPLSSPAALPSPTPLPAVEPTPPATSTPEAAEDNSSWLSYTSPSGDFSIRYPAQATLFEDEVPSADGVLAPAPDTIAIQPADRAFTLVISSFVLPPGTTLPEFVHTHSECVEVTAEKGQAYALGDLDFLLYPDTPCGLAGTSYYYTLAGDMGYRLAVASSLPLESVQGDVEAILQTFRPGAAAAGSDEKPQPDYLAHSLSTSPDGQWLAEGRLAYVTEGDNVVGYDTEFRVSRADGAAAWLLMDRVQGAGMGYDVPEVIRWSADGQTLTFTDRPVPDGCGLFVNGSNLFQADLATGQVAELMPTLARSLALSADAGRVAYLPWGPAPDLVLRDLATGAERQVTLDIPLADAGNLVWSPDGQSLALVQAVDPCSNTTTHSIFRVNLETGAVETLLEADERQFTIVEWPEMNALRLQDKDGGWWRLDPDTGTLDPE